MLVKITLKMYLRRLRIFLENECVIQYKGKKYRILDFEFYFYNKNHQDISVHPRNSKALCWYVNDFGGIDLNFESDIKGIVPEGDIWSCKYELTDNSYFGGILIRQVREIDEDMKIYDGPWKVAELFRVLDATSQTQDNPVLMIEKLEPIEFQEPKKRYNLLGKRSAKEKADYNLKECFLEVSDSKKRILEDKLAVFKESPYRYCWVKKF